MLSGGTQLATQLLHQAARQGAHTIYSPKGEGITLSCCPSYSTAIGRDMLLLIVPNAAVHNNLRLVFVSLLYHRPTITATRSFKPNPFLGFQCRNSIPGKGLGLHTSWHSPATSCHKTWILQSTGKQSQQQTCRTTLQSQMIPATGHRDI